MKNPLKSLLRDGGYTAIFRTIGVIGDSLASGEYESYDGERSGYHDYYEYSWGQFMARKCGSTVHNFSCGGLTAKGFLELAPAYKCFTPEKACQAYIIALGRNDMNGWGEDLSGFGRIDDVGFDSYNNNKDTFVGNYVKIIQKLRENQPKCRIFLVTMPHSYGDVGKLDEKCDKHAEFLNSLPKYFDFLYVIDLRKYAPEHTHEFHDTYYCGGHMNAMGYMLTAEQISTYIDYIIRSNPKDFTQVAFIGKDIHNVKEKW